MLHQKISAIIFLFVIFGFCAGMPLGTFGTVKRHAARAEKGIADQNDVSVPPAAAVSPESQFLRSVRIGFERILRAIRNGNFSKQIEEQSCFRLPCIMMYGAIQYLMGKRVILDADPSRTLYKKDNDQLVWLVPVSRKLIQDRAEFLQDVSGYLKTQNTSFLFIQVPGKCSPNNNEVMPGIDDPFNEQQDYFLSLLQERNVPFLDLRQEMLRDHINWDTAFYRTDHHWTVETAFWAWTKTLPVLADMIPGLREKQEFLTDINQYETAIVTNKWVGSMGRRIGSFYAGTEVLSYYRPRFKTNFKVTKLSASGNPLSEKNGHFEQSIYNGWEDFESFSPGRQWNVINTEGTGNVLFISDSYAIPFCAYAALHLHRTTRLDPREFTGSLSLFLQKNRYDCVIIMLTPNVFYNDDESFVRHVRQELQEGKPD